MSPKILKMLSPGARNQLELEQNATRIDQTIAELFATDKPTRAQRRKVERMLECAERVLSHERT